MQVRFIQVVLAIIDQRNIITRLVHMQRDIGMMGGIIIHQRHKQTGDIHDSQQEEKQRILVPGQKRSQEWSFGKVNKLSAV